MNNTINLQRIENIVAENVEHGKLYIWRAGHYVTIIVRKSDDGTSLISADAFGPELWPFDSGLSGVLYGPFILDGASPYIVIPNE